MLLTGLLCLLLGQDPAPAPAPGPEEAKAAESQAMQEKLEELTGAFEGVVAELKERIQKGVPPSVALAQLEKETEKALETPAKEAHRKTLETALQVLRDETLRPHLVREAGRQRIPEWAIEKERGSRQAADLSGIEASHEGLLKVWDNAKSAPAMPVVPRQGTPAFGIPSNPRPGTSMEAWERRRAVQDKLENLKLDTTRQRQETSDAVRLGREASLHRSKIEQIEREGRKEEEELPGREKALSELDAQIELALFPIRNDIARRDTLARQYQDLTTSRINQMQIFTADKKRVDAIRIQADAIDREMKADPTAFYNRHTAQCQIVREWVEGNTRRIDYRYLPHDKLIAEGNQLIARGNAAFQEAERLEQQINGVKPPLDALNARLRDPEAKAKQLKARRDELKKSLDQYKAQAAERARLRDGLKAKLEEIRARLDQVVARLKGKLEEAEAWVRDSREWIRQFQQ